ncbi:MAG: DUF1134 domain-containing protein [Rhodospirillales bacterium]|jgi:hypothetical protein|nr:DUF1134 domain-containing protein [Rhodospirillales bacterium]
MEQRIYGALIALVVVFGLNSTASAQSDGTFDEQEILKAATDFFGGTTAGLAKVIQKVFEDRGRPNGFIAGEEISGAFVVGLRYGNGTLNRKTDGTAKVYWQGPSVGFDFGGNASKVFTLVYGLESTDDLFQRYPGVEGSFYFVAGVGVNYQKGGDVILAPVRTGVGLRAGANVGYLHYNKEHSWIPF